MCPFIVTRIAGSYLATPVKRESYLVQLLTIAVDVLFCRDGWMLTCLDGILLSRQTVGIVAHGVQHVVAVQPLVACIDIRCDISQRVSYVQTCTAGVGEHVQHIELLLVLVLHYTIRAVFHPSFLPFLFNLSEIVFHNIYLFFIVSIIPICKDKLF